MPQKTISIRHRTLKGSELYKRSSWTVNPSCFEVDLSFKIHRFGVSPVLTMPEQTKIGVWKMIAADEKLYRLVQAILGLPGVMSVEMSSNMLRILVKSRCDELMIAEGIQAAFKTHYRAECEEKKAA